MKKLIITLIIIVAFLPFFTKKNDYKDISKVVYISSIGLDYDENNKEYTIYYYILNNFNLTGAQISSSNIDDLSYMVKISDTNFAKAFSSIIKKTNIGIHYTHLKTVILSNNFVGQIPILDFYNYIRDLNQIYLNFYLFTTDSKIEDLYNIQNFSDVSAYHTILINPNLIKTYKLVTFIDFAKEILKPNYTFLIPHISSVSDTFFKQDKEYLSLEMDGYSILQNDYSIKTYITKEYQSLRWLMNLPDQHFQIDEYEIYLKDGKYKIKNKEDKIIIYYKLSAVLNLNPKNEKLVDVKEKLEKKIADDIIEFITLTKDNNIDIFNLNYLISPNSLFEKKIEVKINLNLN